MTAVTESLKPGQKKQKDRRQEDIKEKQAIQEVVVNDPKKNEVPLAKEESTPAENLLTKQEEIDEHYRVNDVLIGCADGLKQIHDGLTSIETSENEYGIAKAVILTLAFEFIASIEKRAKNFIDDELEERRRKDRELTEQDKEIMALVKELQDPNLN